MDSYFSQKYLCVSECNFTQGKQFQAKYTLPQSYRKLAKQRVIILFNKYTSIIKTFRNLYRIILFSYTKSKQGKFKAIQAYLTGKQFSRLKTNSIPIWRHISLIRFSISRPVVPNFTVKNQGYLLKHDSVPLLPVHYHVFLRKELWSDFPMYLLNGLPLKLELLLNHRNNYRIIYHSNRTFLPFYYHLTHRWGEKRWIEHSPWASR